MPDPFLEALMKGEHRVGTAGILPPKSKDRFEIALDTHIKKFLSSINFEDECLNNRMVTPEIKRAQKKSELIRQFKLKDNSNLILRAKNVFIEEGKRILDESKYYETLIAFYALAERLAKLDLESNLSENFQTILEVQNETLESIDFVSQHLFETGSYKDSQALNTLLFTLVPENSLYWYRAGLAAHNCEDFNFAIEAYVKASTIDPTLIGAFLFAAECFIRQGLKQEALQSIEKAKATEESSNPSWLDLINKLEQWALELKN